MKCSVTDCLEEMDSLDTLFCKQCRANWRTVIDINNYTLKTPITIIDKVLKKSQSSII